VEELLSFFSTHKKYFCIQRCRTKVTGILKLLSTFTEKRGDNNLDIVGLSGVLLFDESWPRG
jgi:hypothetical protein